MAARKGPNGRCQICTSPNRVQIEYLMVAGASRRSLGDKFGVSDDAIHRHFHKHCTPAQKAAYASKSLRPGVELQQLVEKEGGGVLEHLAATRSKIHYLIDGALEVGDRNGAALLIGRLHENLNMTARLTGELMKHLPPGHVTNVLITQAPQVLELQSRLLRALAPFPDARKAVLEEFRQAEALALPVAPPANVIDVTPDEAA